MERDHPLWPYFSQTTQRALDCYQEPGPWMTAHVATRISWPKINQVVVFQHREFLLLPSTNEWMPGIALNMRLSEITEPDEARTVLSRFASAMSWHEQVSLAIADFTFDGQCPVHRHVRRIRPISEYLYLGMRRLEAIDDPRALRALALFREGLSSESEFYAALNFFKVIGNFVEGPKRKDWFERSVSKIRKPDVLNRIRTIEQSGASKVGDYLFLQGRNAVAHARKDAAVDPDDNQERFRFASDLLVYKELSVLAIEEFVGISHSRATPVSSTNGIKGFMDAQDKQLLAWLRYRDRPMPDVSLAVPSPATLVVMRAGETLAISGMHVEQTAVRDRGIAMAFVGTENVAALSFHFDLERKELHPLGLTIPSEPSDRFTRAMLDEVATVFQFDNMLWGNGTAWIIDEESNSVWGCTGAVIPLNELHAPHLAVPFVERLGELIHQRTISETGQ